MNKLNIVYFGSSYFSANFLEKLITDASMYRYVEVKLVVTQPSRLAGRKQILTPTSVKTTALKYGLEVLEIDNLRLNENCILKIENCDICLLYAYGVIIPKEFLALPKYGFWCIHPSFLPKYRGTSPMATSLINGDKETGVTIIKMDEKIDSGPIISQEKYKIQTIDRRPDLEKKLTDLAVKMFKRTTTQLINSRINPTSLKLRGVNKLKTKEQNHKEATYTKKLTKQDGFIEFEKIKKIFLHPTNYELQTISNLFRGLHPWPGIWTLIKPSLLRSEAGKPGRLKKQRLKITDLELIDGKLIIKKVQLEGKKEVDFEIFNKAYKIF